MRVKIVGFVLYYRVIALILVNIAHYWDIKGCEQYSLISVQ